jgi:SAM-dependent methyltransferase
MSSGRQDWQAWHRDYDDPGSSVSHRLVEVRARLAMLLDEGEGPVRLLNLCCGDGRDTISVLATSDREVDACLVELDAGLSDAARRAALDAGVRADVRTGDAADPSTYADRLPVDLLVLVGLLGNVSDADAERTVAAAAAMVVPGGTVLWSRSNRFRADPTHTYADPAAWVRDLFEAVGFETIDYVRPEHEAWRLGVGRLRERSRQPLPERLFTFVR